MKYIDKYLSVFLNALKESEFQQSPQELYEPMNYIMALGGKRLRPVICLMGCDLFEGDLNKALKPALGIEAFHNFTLMHDDIMDSAQIRRGKKSVHYKYGLNSGILSGDALLIKAYQFFEDLEAVDFKTIIQLFSKTAIQICEGQQLDMNFAEQKEVDTNDYFEMITLKTGVLAAAALKIGALIAGAKDEDADHIYEFGKHIGIAFQLMDDYLDVFGDANQIGKKHGGDIFENKKTILFLKAREKAINEDLDELMFWYGMKTENVDKLYAVEKIFRRLDVGDDVEKLIKFHTNSGLEHLKVIDVSEERKAPLKALTEYLLQRTE